MKKYNIIGFRKYIIDTHLLDELKDKDISFKYFTYYFFNNVSIILWILFPVTIPFWYIEKKRIESILENNPHYLI